MSGENTVRSINNYINSLDEINVLLKEYADEVDSEMREIYTKQVDVTSKIMFNKSDDSRNLDTPKMKSENKKYAL